MKLARAEVEAWVGSFGCNLRCPFCQNWEISMSDGGEFTRDEGRFLPPEKLAELAEKLLPVADALNIDLKSFRAETYERTLGGDLETVKRFIARAAENCHVELTTLIVPGLNDTEEEIRDLTDWIASLPNGEEIPLRLTRFFPRYNMTDGGATERQSVLRLVSVARERLRHVYPGNM